MVNIELKDHLNKDAFQDYQYPYNKRQATVSQVCIAFIGNLIMLQTGMTFGVTIVTNGKLMSTSSNLSTSTFRLSHSEASWSVSMILISYPLGSLFSSYLQEKYGRRKCLVLVPIPEVLGWLSLWFATSKYFLYFSSSCLGFAMGISEAPILTYIGESIEPRIRSTLSSCASLSTELGFFVTFFLAIWFSWKQIALFFSVLPVLIIVLVLLMIPESPVWLLSKGKVKDATNSLRWLRGSASESEVQLEMSEMQKFVHEHNIHENPKKKDQRFLISSIVRIIRVLRADDVFQPLVMLNVIFMICTFSSMSPAKPFIVSILRDIGLPLNDTLALVIIGSMTLGGSLLNVMTIGNIAKRKLLLCATFVSVTCQSIVGLYAMDMLTFLTNSSWFPYTLFCIISFTSSFGISTIPWIILGEIFPVKGRGVASGLTAALHCVLEFFLTMMYWNVVHVFSLPVTLIIFAIFGFCGIPYIYYMLPETENKTLQQIQRDFSCKRKQKLIKIAETNV